MSKYYSKLASYIEDYINQKRSMGYSFILQEKNLQRFDRFIVEKNLDKGIIDEDVINSWECRFPGEGDVGRNARLQVISGLADYMEQFGIQSSRSKSYGSVNNKTPYIPSEKEIAELFNVIDNYKVKKNQKLSRLSAEYSIMFRLFYLAGLRLNEPVVLKRNDVKLEEGYIYIRHSKGDKDRVIVLADDFADLVRRYDSKMECEYITNREWFFPGFNIYKPFTKTTIDSKFKQFWEQAFPYWDNRRPTVHSLRHAFVVNRINTWAKAGLDFDIMVPLLKTYLGHASIEETYYYYHMLDPRNQTIRKILEETSISRGELL